MTDLGFRLDAESTVRPWEQLRRHIHKAIATGVMTKGERLPAIRSLADAVGMAPNTVARAIKELEADGVLVTSGRHGTYVQSAPSADVELDELAARYVNEARAAGGTNQALVDAVRRATAEP